MFEVGDKVVSERYGKGVVRKTDFDGDGESYPILVEFKRDGALESYTIEGFYSNENEKADDYSIKLKLRGNNSKHKTTSVAGFGFLLELDNGICIYHPNQGQPFQVYPKSTNERLS